MDGSRRLIIGVTAVALCLASVGLVLSLATHGAKSPPCPHCHAPGSALTLNSKSYSLYVCRECGETFEGPARQDFSWAGAIHVMLQDAGY